MANPSLRVRPSTYAIHQCTPNGVIHWSSSYFSTTYSILPQWLKIHPQKSHFFRQNINIRCRKAEIHLHSGQKFCLLCSAQFVSSLEFPNLHLFNLPGLDTYSVSPKRIFFHDRSPNSKCCF